MWKYSDYSARNGMQSYKDTLQGILHVMAYLTICQMLSTCTCMKILNLYDTKSSEIASYSFS